MHHPNKPPEGSLRPAQYSVLNDILLVLATDSRGLITYCNETVSEISGYSCSELIGKSYELLKATCYNHTIKVECCGVLHEYGKWQGEICATSKSGVQFWLHTNVVVCTDENGAISGYETISSNITKYMLSVVKGAETDDKHRNLFDYSPIPMWIYNRQTLAFMDVNQAAIRKYQYGKEEFLGMTIKQIRPMAEIPKLETALAKTRETVYRNFNETFKHTKKNGTIINVNIQSNPIMYEGEQAMLVMATDVTEELEAKAALTLANMRLTTAQEIAKLGYWSNDLQNSVIHWSDEMYNMFDLNKESFELTLANIAKMYHPEDRWRMEANIDATFLDKEIDEFDNRIIMPGGKTKWIHQKIRLIRDSENRPLALDGVLQDVTESKEKEQHLAESNERYKLLMKASREAMIDWDIVRDVTIWGDGFTTIFGYDLSVYDNYLWSGNIHSDDREQVLKGLEETLANPLKNVFYADFRYLKANRDVAYVQHRGLIVRDKNGKPVRAVGSLLDMTEMMERKIKIENQNRAFNEIAWIQSHKVRGPLTSIMGLVNVLKMPIEVDTTEENLLELISLAANELDNIIHEIVEKSEKVVFDEQHQDATGILLPKIYILPNI